MQCSAPAAMRMIFSFWIDPFTFSNASEAVGPTLPEKYTLPSESSTSVLCRPQATLESTFESKKMPGTAIGLVWGASTFIPRAPSAEPPHVYSGDTTAPSPSLEYDVDVSTIAAVCQTPQATLVIRFPSSAATARGATTDRASPWPSLPL